MSKIIGKTRFFSFGKETNLGEGKILNLKSKDIVPTPPSCSVVANMLGCGIMVNEFYFQSLYYV